MEPSIEYRWQARHGNVWCDDGKSTTSYRKALRYLDVAANCTDCDGHRLTMTVFNPKKYHVRLFYTLNSRPTKG